MNSPMISNAIESALIQGDLSKLTVDQRLNYFKSVCESVGLNPLTKPFEFIILNGKLTLYAKRDATDQLRKVHKVSITISSREQIGDVYVVTAKAKDKDGREDESTGAVFIAGIKGEALANAYMKAETKAKRRVTLSVCGLGILDETEVADIPATPEPKQVEEKKVLPPSVAENLFHGDGELVSDLGAFKITFGKHKGKALAEMDIFELENYYQWLAKSSQASDKPQSQNILDTIEHTRAYLESKSFDRGARNA